MANKYSKLCIDTKKITSWIQLWCEEELEGPFEIVSKEIKDRIQYTINNHGNIIKIDFLKCNGGLLTICPNVGTNIKFSTKIADSIYERVKNVIKDSPFANGFSVILKPEDFQAVIELIKGMDGVSLKNYGEQINPDIANYYLYQFQGQAKDIITIKYYIRTNRMQLQGKPLFLFNEVVSMVSENGATFEDVVDAQIRYCSVSISNNDIFEEMQSVLGKKLFEFLSTSLKAILSTAFILAKIDIEMQDYSGVVQQALRAYEGYAKKLFSYKGLECEGDKQLGSFFHRPDKTSKFIMNDEFRRKIDEETEKYFTAIYVFYYNKRHPYLHATSRDFDTRIISDRKVADALFSEIIVSMKTWYETIVIG